MTKICIASTSAVELSGFPVFPQSLAQRLQKDFPETTVALLQDPARRREEFHDTTVLFSLRLSPEDFRAAPRLRWLHLPSAGATHVLFPELVASDVVVTNSRGLHAIPIAEHILGVMIILARKLHDAYRFQLAGKWARREMFERYPTFSELHGHAVGIIGLGNIGLAVAERVKALGMRVIASKRSPGTPPACVDELVGPAGLPQLLQTADFVIIAAPLTRETQGLIGEKELRQMKPTAYILNVGRGAIIQEAALIHALKEEWIAGAGLDVTEKEPLPAESELFHLPNVFLTPHYSGLRSQYWERALEMFAANLRRFVRGEMLENLVDKRGGY